MYQALYRKYRPKQFNEVVGQESVIKILKNTIKTGHIGHAYLFSGPRGTGKTTIAKIFARAVNCNNPQEGELCNTCENCQLSSSKECLDIIEIDAASNNGVDEIRELRNKVNILPSELKYKVYIIDEVHMLSIGAFNALLKTLEEPPHHVIFILATTDPQKIPPTIISRCQCFQFKKMTPIETQNHLKKIALQESILIDDDVLEEIAKSSDGGMRDAIGVLDKISAANSSKITINDFLELNGQEKTIEIEDFLNKIFQKQQKEVLEKISQFYQDGKDLIQITKQTMKVLRDALVNYYLGKQDLPYEEQEAIDFINLLNEKIIDLKKADDIKISLEIMILHFMEKYSESKKIISREIISPPVTVNKLEELSQKKESKPKEIPKELQPEEKKVRQEESKEWKNLMTIRSRNTLIDAKKTELLKEQENWKKIEEFTFDRKFGYLACELLDGTPRASNDTTIIISFPYESMLEKGLSHLEELKEFYQKHTQSSKKFSFLLEEDWNNLKKEYITKIKEGSNFKLEEEPIIKQKENTQQEENQESKEEKMIRDAISLFGEDVVEIK